MIADMTDARFPERWLQDRRVMRLSPDAFRAFVLSLAWSASNRTDGLVERADLPLLPWCSPEVVEELVAGDVWEVAGDGWNMPDYLGTQSTRAVLEALEHKRAMTRERVARHRSKQRAGDPNEETDDGYSTRDVTGPVTHNVTRYTKDRTGQDRTGQERSSIQQSFETETVEPEPDPDSSGAGFCSGCGDELTGDVCSWCSPARVPAPAPAVEPPPVSPVADGGCTVPGCAGVVTDYLRRTYGPVCASHVSVGVAE